MINMQPFDRPRNTLTMRNTYGALVPARSLVVHPQIVSLGDEGKNKWYVVLYIIHLSTNIHSMVEHSEYINALTRLAWPVSAFRF